MRGRFSDDNIIISFDVYGVSDELQRSFEGIVDTGFSGYLTLPFVSAFPLGLVLKGEQSHTLANGQMTTHFVCLGTVTFQGQKVVVPIDVQPSGPILVGMQLLKRLGFDLNINFVDESFEFTSSNSKAKQSAPKVKLNL